MMVADWPVLKGIFKSFLVAALLFPLAGCSVNPATGQQQFAALMSPEQESRVGMEEHQNVMKEFGVPPDSEDLQIYVSRVGASVAQNTERPDVQYKFFVLDDPMVNAFALPGGYVYVTRGLLAQANSEAELAAVLGHEVGHITARHSAERYSRGVVTSLGAAVLSAALDSGTAAQALEVGSDLYMKSYSRGQETQADELGMRYLSRTNYDPAAMVAFLSGLEAHTALDGRMNGKSAPDIDWFSTHPLTATRVQEAVALAGQYPRQNTVALRDEYLRMIDGLVYGDSERQGFTRDNTFYHTQMDFTFSVPQGFKLDNQTRQVVATNGGGAVILFDAAANTQGADAMTFLSRDWMKGKPLPDAERITINGKDAATASFSGTVGGQPVTIRIVAVAWKPGTVFRFQIALPEGASPALVEDIKRATYSLRPLTEAEKRDVKPYRLRVVTAGPGDSAASLAARMSGGALREERFRVLNGMGPGEAVVAGRLYKAVF